MYKEITERLHDNDVHMVKRYLSNVRSELDVRYVFAPGDYVLLRRRGGTNYQSELMDLTDSSNTMVSHPNASPQ